MISELILILFGFISKLQLKNNTRQFLMYNYENIVQSGL